ncbi:DoxX family protein [Natronospira sp. AB-CW4]|uniref:DoxX family protein n=1 Tax=Natronospira bacteriovora TaxID=3069753 RepID=A0ABU0W507_9GAMM|nr:DoxX family protein [Natronospira sp. AB-CW4]MDQ2069094.1 DoxX family protein [Natronospira sp. AB-CW4]
MKDNVIDLAGRVLLGLIFLIAGIGKIGSGFGLGFGYEATQGYMEAMGVPGILLLPTILLEVLGGLALILGIKARWAAAALAAFTLLAGFLFHFDLGDANETNHLLKNLAISGGLLLVFVHGVKDFALGHRFNLS